MNRWWEWQPLPIIGLQCFRRCKSQGALKTCRRAMQRRGSIPHGSSSRWSRMRQTPPLQPQPRRGKCGDAEHPRHDSRWVSDGCRTSSVSRIWMCVSLRVFIDFASALLSGTPDGRSPLFQPPQRPQGKDSRRHRTRGKRRRTSTCNSSSNGQQSAWQCTIELKQSGAAPACFVVADQKAAHKLYCG